MVSADGTVMSISGLQIPIASSSTVNSITLPLQCVNSLVFTYEELYIILEHICDFIGCVEGFIVSVFTTYDCDPVKLNLLQPLISYIVQCSRYVSKTCNL